MNLKELAPKKTQRLNKVMESRFGFQIDYDNLSYAKAQRLSNSISESLNAIRRTHGAHTAEQNPKYMEMLMVKEGLNAWMAQQSVLTEGELEAAEVVLAAKSMVDSVQDMITDASKMLNEELPPLISTIRDQVGTAQADTFKNTVAAALQELMTSLNSARDALDNGSRALAGEDTGSMAADIGGGLDAAASADLETGLPAPEASDLDTGDGFDASDAAVGGEESLGRAAR